MFTLNNYTEDDIDRLCDMDPDKALVVIGQRSLRLQGPRTYKATSSLETIVLFPLSVARTRAHIEIAVKSPWHVACIAQRTDSG